MKKFKTEAQEERTERRRERKNKGRQKARMQVQSPPEGELFNIISHGAFIAR